MIRVFSQYVSPKSILLMAIEGFLIVLSLLAGIRLRFWNNPVEFDNYIVLPDFAIQALIIALTFQICFYYNDLYDLSAVRRRGEQLARLGQSLGAACLLLGFIYFFLPVLLIGRGVFFITMGLALGSILLTRIVLDSAWLATAPAQNLMLLGMGDLAAGVAQEISKRHDLNIRLVGFVAPSQQDLALNKQDLGHPILGTTSELESLVAENKIDRIIVAVEDCRGMLPIRDLVRLRIGGVHIEDAQSALASLTGRVCLAGVRPSWFVFSDGFHRSRVTATVKRIVDLAFGLMGLVLSLPIMAVVALAVWLDSGWPILYRQTRVGLRGQCFELIKFRSMRLDAEEANGAQWAQEQDPRVTRVGRFIRKFRLDELPQFVNVMRGEMSFVGPRPERPVFVQTLREQIAYYDERHSVRPGLTGWAQVQYPYGASVEDAFRKLEYDLFYLKNMTALFDCAIVFQTVRKVIFGSGGR